MSNESEHPAIEPKHEVYRTTPERTGKMMIIMLGICIVGAIIFFSMWDYWISQPAPVVAMMAGEAEHAAPAAATGKPITQDLTFIESSDFRTLAFNALPGEGSLPQMDSSIFHPDQMGHGYLQVFLFLNYKSCLPRRLPC